MSLALFAAGLILLGLALYYLLAPRVEDPRPGPLPLPADRFREPPFDCERHQAIQARDRGRRRTQ